MYLFIKGRIYIKISISKLCLKVGIYFKGKFGM